MRHDVIVVGAGSAGAVIATRLAEQTDLSVLLLEAGPDYPNLETLPHDIRYGAASGVKLAVDDRHRWPFVARATATAPPMDVPRGRITGGTSAINGQIFLRGLPEDYDEWAAEGNPGWSYADVLPHLRAIEDDRDFGALPEHGVGGPIPVVRHTREQWVAAHAAFYEACRAEGFPDCQDANAPESTGVGPYPLNNVDGVRISTAIGYLPRARGLPNFRLEADALVRRVLLDGTRATGVEYEQGGEIKVAEAEEVVLSGGVFGSPQILMLSGIGPRDQLETCGIEVVRELPGVGQNLQDHPTPIMIWRAREPLTDSPVRVQMLLRYTAAGSDLRNDVWVCPLTDGDEIRMYPGLMRAAGAGEVRLVSPDPSVQLEIDYRYLEPEFDLRRVREAVRLCLRLAEHPALAALIAERVSPTDADLASDDALDAWMLRNVTTGQHPACTCKMGPATDPLAVVDAEGRVHGIAGLRVADASIMPVIPRANTNVSTLMIGERIAAVLADALVHA